MTTLHTVRLILRPWRDSDLEPFAALNADPDVMRHFPAVLDRDQSDRFAGRLRDVFEPAGWGLWALEVRAGEPFIGFVGLSRPNFTAHFTPAVEIGWRLAKTAWGMGYATEAARAAVAYGFDQLRLDEVVSFTSVGNAPSRRVMEKLGMTHDPSDDFDHPNLADGHRLRRHVLYRVAAPGRMPR